MLRPVYVTPAWSRHPSRQLASFCSSLNVESSLTFEKPVSRCLSQMYCWASPLQYSFILKSIHHLICGVFSRVLEYSVMLLLVKTCSRLLHLLELKSSTLQGVASYFLSITGYDSLLGLSRSALARTTKAILCLSVYVEPQHLFCNSVNCSLRWSYAKNLYALQEHHLHFC